jgi:general secretion pathway protein D
MVAEVTLTDNLRFGLQWLIQNDVKLQVKPFENDINLSGPLAFKSLIDGATLTYTALDLAGNTKLLIQALADDNKARILSSPHVLVSDNREARIQVGDQIPISTSTTSTPIGGTVPTNTTTSTIQYKDTGTILTVKPQVNDSGLVNLEISQEVSKANIVNVLGTQQYQITKRDISTSLVAQDGQTIVLGGLIDETSSKGRSGIPFLSKIPILGYLFGSTIDDTTRTELIILLTPHVIRNQQESGKTSSDYLNRFKENTKIDIDGLKKDKGKNIQDGGDAGNKDSGQDNP